jgi:hypothetical protein
LASLPLSLLQRIGYGTLDDLHDRVPIVAPFVGSTCRFKAPQSPDDASQVPSHRLSRDLALRAPQPLQIVAASCW